MKIEIKNRWTGAVQFACELTAEIADKSYSVQLGFAATTALADGANLRDADLGGANLRDANLRGANLRDADLGDADLGGANLGDANLRGANLGGANLRGANLRDADLGGANLGGANLGDANLGDANLRDANLRGANLGDADLGGADLGDANLRDANLRGADLRDADLGDANLGGANLGGADLGGANLGGANLRSFKADLWMTLTDNWHEVPALVTALREGRVNGSTYTGSCACLVGTIANAKGISYETLAHDSNNPAEQWFLMIKTGDTPDSDTGGGFACKKALEWTLEWCALNGVALPEVAA
jgi:uncharacterized protein YjbI with pentapeptide repeats